MNQNGSGKRGGADFKTKPKAKHCLLQIPLIHYTPACENVPVSECSDSVDSIS